MNAKRFCGWNHRVLRKPDAFLGEVFAVHEVYYDAKTKEPKSCTVDPVEPMGETLEQLRSEIQMFMAATEKPVLDYEKDFSWSTKKGEMNMPAIPRKSRHDRATPPEDPTR